ncbi:MAG TPA: DUF4350 domain-containing protein [Herpetosiphonaceae bacterium]|nr:DUF4350 domain-containing protein [Herpetosiphonaceae bacterium]
MRRFALPLIIVVLVGGCYFAFRALVNDIPTRFEPGSIYNTQPNGGAAMQRWLDDLGYRVQTMEYVEWEFDEQQDAVLILAPTSFFQAGEPETILEWVRDTGGTLILADDEDNSLYRELNIELTDFETTVSGVITAAQPLGNPAAPELSLPGATPYFSTSRRDAVVLAGSEDKPVVLALAEGRGVVYLVSSFDVLTNLGLRTEANARLAQNLLSRVPEGGTVVFDEIHHGRALPPKVPRNPVVFSPLVAAVIYSALVIGLWAWLNGRRFGTVVPLREEVARRSSAEYVQSMAGLFQRGRQTGYILSHYKTAFKRRIAKPYGFNPRLVDEDYVRELRRFTSVDENRLLGLLQALGNPNPSEEALLRLVNAADSFALEFERQA